MAEDQKIDHESTKRFLAKYLAPPQSIFMNCPIIRDFRNNTIDYSMHVLSNLMKDLDKSSPIPLKSYIKKFNNHKIVDLAKFDPFAEYDQAIRLVKYLDDYYDIMPNSSFHTVFNEVATDRNGKKSYISHDYIKQQDEELVLHFDHDDNILNRNMMLAYIIAYLHISNVVEENSDGIAAYLETFPFEFNTGFIMYHEDLDKTNIYYFNNEANISKFIRVYFNMIDVVQYCNKKLNDICWTRDCCS